MSERLVYLHIPLNDIVMYYTCLGRFIFLLSKLKKSGYLFGEAKILLPLHRI